MIRQLGTFLAAMLVSGCASNVPKDDVKDDLTEFEGWQLSFCAGGPKPAPHRGFIHYGIGSAPSASTGLKALSALLGTNVPGAYDRVAYISEVRSDYERGVYAGTGVLAIDTALKEACMVGEVAEVDDQVPKPFPKGIPLTQARFDFECSPGLLKKAKTPCTDSLVMRGRTGGTIDLVFARELIRAGIPLVRARLAYDADLAQKKDEENASSENHESQKARERNQRRQALKSGTLQPTTFDDALLMYDARSVIETAQLLASPKVTPDFQIYEGIGQADKWFAKGLLACRPNETAPSRFMLSVDDKTKMLGDEFRLNQPFRFVGRYQANGEATTESGSTIQTVRFQALAIQSIDPLGFFGLRENQQRVGPAARSTTVSPSLQRARDLKAGRVPVESLSDVVLQKFHSGIMEPRKIIFRPAHTPDMRYYFGKASCHSAAEDAHLCMLEEGGVKDGQRFILTFDERLQKFGGPFDPRSPFAFVGRYVANDTLRINGVAFIKAPRFRAEAVHAAGGLPVED